MCLLVSKRRAKVLTSKRPIYVYKILKRQRGKYISYYREFRYTTKKEMVAKKFLDSAIRVGLHRCGGLPYYQDNDTVSLFDGFHSFICERDARILKDMLPKSTIPVTIVKFMIPPGTSYIRGKFDYFENILSEKLKFVKDLDICE